MVNHKKTDSTGITYRSQESKEICRGLPSIEMVIKMAKDFDISVDFLLGEREFASFDKEFMDRIKGFENLEQNTKAKIFDFIDTYIRDSKAGAAYA